MKAFWTYLTDLIFFKPRYYVACNGKKIRFQFKMLSFEPFGAVSSRSLFLLKSRYSSLSVKNPCKTTKKWNKNRISVAHDVLSRYEEDWFRSEHSKTFHLSHWGLSRSSLHPRDNFESHHGPFSYVGMYCIHSTHDNMIWIWILWIIDYSYSE